MAVEAAVQPALLIIPSILLGIIIGLIEIFFVHSDEAGMGWFKHALHAFPFAILFTFLAINANWALGFFNLGNSFIWVLIARVAVGIVAMIKIQTAAAIAGATGEKLSTLLS